MLRFSILLLSGPAFAQQLTISTVVVTAYLYKLNVFVGITCTFLAKHILVAILVAGLGYKTEKDER